MFKRMIRRFFLVFRGPKFEPGTVYYEHGVRREVGTPHRDWYAATYIYPVRYTDFIVSEGIVQHYLKCPKDRKGPS